MSNVEVKCWCGDFRYTLAISPFDWEELLARCGWTPLNSVDRDSLPREHQAAIRRLMDKECIQMPTDRQQAVQWWKDRTLLKACTSSYMAMRHGFDHPVGKRIEDRATGRTGKVVDHITVDNGLVDATAIIVAWKDAKLPERVSVESIQTATRKKRTA